MFSHSGKRIGGGSAVYVNNRTGKAEIRRHGVGDFLASAGRPRPFLRGMLDYDVDKGGYRHLQGTASSAPRQGGKGCEINGAYASDIRRYGLSLLP